MNSTRSYSPETPNLGQIPRFLEPCDLAISRMTLNKANLRDLIAATGLVILLKLDWNGQFFASVTLRFDGWPRKITRHVCYTKPSFVYRFRSISEFKLELQSENVQSGSNLMIFWAVWPCNLTYDLEQGKSKGFHSCGRPSNLAQIEFKSLILQPMWPWYLMDDQKKQ